MHLKYDLDLYNNQLLFYDCGPIITLCIIWASHFSSTISWLQPQKPSGGRSVQVHLMHNRENTTIRVFSHVCWQRRVVTKQTVAEQKNTNRAICTLCQYQIAFRRQPNRLLFPEAIWLLCRDIGAIIHTFVGNMTRNCLTRWRQSFPRAYFSRFFENNWPGIGNVILEGIIRENNLICFGTFTVRI